MENNLAPAAILSCLQEKNRLLKQILEATKGLECASLDDEMLLESFLNIRQTAMNKIDELDKTIGEFLWDLPHPLRSRIKNLISSQEEQADLDSQVELSIFDTNKRNILILKKIGESDARFNKSVKKRLDM